MLFLACFLPPPSGRSKVNTPMTTHTAVVDDRDPTIAYSGSWGPAGSAEEFKDTTTYSAGPDALATFSFVGTSVTVYGTIGVRNLTTQPTWAFVVDGSVLGKFTPTQGMSANVHHQALWTSPSLSVNDGLHKLVIKQTTNTTISVIYLDYIMFTTTTSASVAAYFVDDRDSRVRYSPAWQFYGLDGDLHHTSQASRVQGDSLTLQFEGKSISFYGGVTSSTVNASMSIDGGPLAFWVPPVTAGRTNNLIFDSGDLTPGTHELVVTATNDQPVWADYFLITPNPAGSVSSSSSGGISSSSAFPSPSSIGSHSNAHSKPARPRGTIVGVVVGIGLPLLLGLSLFICWWRKRRGKGHVQNSDSAHNQPPQMTNAPVSLTALDSSPADSHGRYHVQPFVGTLPTQGQARGGMNLSNKLTRGMEGPGARQRDVATAPLLWTSATLQQRESHGAPPEYEE